METQSKSSDKLSETSSRRFYGAIEPPAGPEVKISRTSSDASLVKEDEEKANDAEAQRVRRTSVTAEGLPDLTDRILEQGIYGEYQAYREGYLKWRKGEGCGARGGLSYAQLSKAKSDDPYNFEEIYPTAYIFKWRFTTAYFQAITFLCGSLLFTFDSYICYIHGPGGKYMKTYPNLFGAVLFTIACYLGYLQLINMTTDTQESVTWLIPYGKMKGLREAVAVSSVVGRLAYFAGAVAFNLGVVGSVMADESRFHWLEAIGNLTGSLFFVLGGACEVLHNRRSALVEPAVWASLANFVGGAAFLAAASPGVLVPSWRGEARDSWVHGSYLVGSALFALSSILLIIMWRANEFGLTLLNQLNFATRGGVKLVMGRGPQGTFMMRAQRRSADEKQQEPETQDSFSPRGVFFILVYCYFLCVALVNCICKILWYSVHHPWSVDNRLLTVVDLGFQVFLILIVVLFMVIHSVVTQVPHEQPFFCAFMSARFILFCGAVLQSITLVQFMRNPTTGLGAKIS
jgi:hypothetical protein